MFPFVVTVQQDQWCNRAYMPWSTSRNIDHQVPSLILEILVSSHLTYWSRLKPCKDQARTTARHQFRADFHLSYTFTNGVSRPPLAYSITSMPPSLLFHHHLLLRHHPSLSQCSRLLIKSPCTTSRTLATIRAAQPRPPPTAPPPRLKNRTPPPRLSSLNGSNLNPLRRFLRSRLLRDTLTFFATIGFISFIWNHVFSIRTVSGDSMYPYLNGEYNTSMEKDRVWVDMWMPMEGLRRGMVVAF